jgi:nucleotide-binding universal stress UspA family protein
VAHELRTPLASIQGYMEGLMDGVVPADAETYEKVHHEADRLQKLVQDLQALSQVESGAFTLDLHTVSVTSLVATVVARLGLQFEEKGVDLVIASTRGHSGLKRLILGSVTQRLMRILPCPLLAVQDPEEGFIAMPGQGIRLKKILVGCDFSADSGLALSYALSLAQEFEAVLHLVHVMEPPTYPEFLTPAEQTQDMVRTDLAPSYFSVAARARPDLVRTVVEMALALGPDVYLRQVEALKHRPDLRPVLPRIGCPTLVLCGDADELCPPVHHAEIAAALPCAELRIIPECGHLSTLEQPGAVSAALGDWLTRPVPTPNG